MQESTEGNRPDERAAIEDLDAHDVTQVSGGFDARSVGTFKPEMRVGTFKPEMSVGTFKPEMRLGTFKPEMRVGTFKPTIL